MVERATVINDPVHGHIELHPRYMKIIDTPQFQRLRFLKQLGTVSFVFPGAVHTRFEHSIGVCHLAETLCKTLKEKQPELNITDDDVQCVAIAGLCHDLGHGPFSHLFDRQFLPKFNIQRKHEEGSVAMFDYLIKENNLGSYFTERDLTFIKEQINPTKDNKDTKWNYKGREQEQSFLYEIVANKKNGIDVDKWDYIARDCYFLKINSPFNHSRLMKFVRVLDVDGEKQICTRAKEVHSLYDLFYSRMCLHRQAYLHKTCLVIDYMICKAFELANEYLSLVVDGAKIKLCEAIYDMPTFVKLDDNIFQSILCSCDVNLQPAQKWLKRILSRKLPKIVGRLKFKDCCGSTGDLWTEDLVKEEIYQAEGNNQTLNIDDLIVIRRRIDYGMDKDNPIDHCWFYNKLKENEPYQVRKEQVSSFLPNEFCDEQFLIFLDGDDAQKFACAQRCYEELCNKHMLQVSMGPEESGIIMTPIKQTSMNEGPDKKRIKRSLEPLDEYP